MTRPALPHVTSARRHARSAVTLMPLLLTVAAQTGCGTRDVVTDHDRSACFVELQTYDWMPGPRRTPDDPRIDDAALDARIRRAIRETLAAKGYTRRTGKGPDFFIGYHAARGAALEVGDIDTYYGYDVERSWGLDDQSMASHTAIGGRVYAYRYPPGTLILDIVDPTMKHLMWRGAAREVFDAETRDAPSATRLREAVNAMLAAFPPEDAAR